MLLSLAVAIFVSVATPAPAPTDLPEGDIVQVDGAWFVVHDGALYAIDDPVVASQLSADAVTVTGSFVDDGAQRVGRTDVVTSSDIAELQARTLADVLAAQAGIQVSSSLGLGQEVQMDGMDARHVLVLVNGRPITGRVNNRVDVGRIPIDAAAIDRIEIVRGPMSALYGSEALGGVINIITKEASIARAAEVEAGASLLGGAVDTTLGLHLRGGIAPLLGRIDVSGADLPGYDRGSTRGNNLPDGKDDAPTRRQLGFHMDGAVPLFDNATLRSSIDFSQAIAASRLSAAVPFFDRATNAELSMAAGIGADLTPHTTLDVDVSVTRYRHLFEKVPTGDGFDAFCGAAGAPLLSRPCAKDPAARTVALLDSTRVEARVKHALWDHPNLRLDVGTLDAAVGTVLLAEQARRKNGAGDDTLPGGGARATASVYLELLWRATSWLSVEPGARLDAYTPSQAAQSTALGPKLAARVDVPLPLGWSGLFVRASYGRGFRLPAFEERYLRFDHSELGYIVQGEPTLLPEINNGIRGEVGFGPAAWLDVGAEIYLNLIDNLIEQRVVGRDPNGTPVFSYTNAARAYTSGVNLRARVGTLWGASVDVSYQYLINAVDASLCPLDNPYFCQQQAASLPLRPVHSLAATAHYAVRATDTALFVRSNYTSERVFDVDTTAPATIDISAGLRQPLFEHAELTLEFANLLDGYDARFGPKPGRHVSFLLRLF